MKRDRYIMWLLIGLGITSIAVGCAGNADKKLVADQPNGLYAVISTAKGNIILRVFFEQAPLTSTNFVGLAEGKFADSIERKERYFDGITFHRVVPDFVIQGGDPKGDGSGGPGYQFPDEFNPNLTHSKAGMLSMANSGPVTNGSQFFITLSPTPHLNNKHSVFGEVVNDESMDVVRQITEGDVMDRVFVVAKGSKAKTFVENISWDAFTALQEEQNDLRKEEKEGAFMKITSEIESDTTPFQKTPEGIYYHEIQAGSGNKVQNGDTVSTHYQLKLYGADDIIDSSYTRNQPFSVVAGSGSVIPGWEIILLTMSEGQKIRAIIPPQFGYGETGAGQVIPPNSFLDFEIEVVSIEK